MRRVRPIDSLERVEPRGYTRGMKPSATVLGRGQVKGERATPTMSRHCRMRAERILTDLLALPTAPFGEQYVIGYAREFCRQRPGLRVSQDKAGNMLIRYRSGHASRRRPLVLTAHMDHPGFIAEAMVAAGRLRARWYGSVRRQYFRDAKVRFFAGDGWIHGRVAEIRMDADGSGRPSARVMFAEVDVPAPVPQGAIGMWDFDDPVIEGGRLFARGCDDAAGSAAALAVLDGLVQTGAAADVYVLLTRAEEAGFVGAIAACRHRTIPANGLVVSIECSSQLPYAKVGDGPIVRVGDYTATFTPGVTAWCRAVADALAAADKSFAYQRRLMDGGTCESAVFYEFGYETTGLCIPLGHYHNMDCERNCLAAEYIDRNDWHNMVRWLSALATSDVKYDGRHPGFRARLRELEKRHAADLRRWNVRVS